MEKHYENIDNKLALAMGRTGNGHVLATMSGKKTIEWTESQHRSMNTVEFRLTEKAILLHPEHAPIVLEPGVYTRTLQVEFNPFDQSVGYIFD